MRNMQRDTDLLTIEEYEALPENDTYRDELSRGLIVREPRPGQQHAEIVGQVGFILKTYLAQHPVGRMLIDGGFILESSAATVRAPDISFVRSERISPQPNPSFFRGAPDLAIEVVSPSNSATELHEKIAEYLAAGTEVVWVLYPQTRTLVTHSRNGESYSLSSADTLRAPEILPEFEIRVERLFM